MRHASVRAVVPGLVLALSLVVGAFADDTSGKAGSVDKDLGKGPAVQESLPSSASPPTTTKHTGATNQSSTVKSMNQKAKEKVDTEGK